MINAGPVFNRIIIVVGDRGQGKTPLIVGGDFEQGMGKSYLAKGMSTLVLDTLDHPKYRHLPILHPKDYMALSYYPGMYRTLANAENMRILIKQYFTLIWNALVVHEDCYKYIADYLDLAARTAIGDSKQQNNDLLYMFPCWSWIPKDLIRITDYYVVFKTQDGPFERVSSMGGCAQKVIEAHNLVMADKSKYIVVDSGI